MNKKYKSVRSLIPPPPFNMVGDGFRVHNFFPSQEVPGLTGMSPFFLMDYNSKWELPPSDRQRGVGVHPHRGFETVSISYHGSIAHHDSAGNSGVINKGDVQWMTAGAGVLHKEYHEKEFSKKGGLFQMVQLWVNLPAKFRMTPAKYQAIENRDMGKFILPDSKSHLDIIAGEYEGIKGPAFTFSPMNLYNAFLEENATVEFSFPEIYNTGLLVVEGSIIVNDTSTANENYFIYLGNEGKWIKLKAKSKSIILVLSGEPINEPIAASGPFVMNTNDEIRRAFEDYYSGKFGHLDD